MGRWSGDGTGIGTGRIDGLPGRDPAAIRWLERGRVARGRASGSVHRRLGRAALLLGLGCAVGSVTPSVAVAPIGVAAGLSMPAIRMAVPAMPIPLDGNILLRPSFAAVPDEVDALLPEEAEARKGDDPADLLRFGSRELPRGLVDTVVRAAGVTGVDPVYLLALAETESSFRPDARAPTSTAEGLFQFIESTWLETVRRHGPVYGLGAEAAAVVIERDRPVVACPVMRAEILDLRRDPYLAAVMAGELIRQDTSRIEARLGRDLRRGEMYLAHFLGSSGAVRFIEAQGLRRPRVAASLFPAAARANRNIFFDRQRRGRRGLSVAEVYARIDRMIETRAATFADAQALLEADRG